MYLQEPPRADGASGSVQFLLLLLCVDCRYAWPKYAAVLMITVGITTCTIVTGKSMVSDEMLVELFFSYVLMLLFADPEN